MSNIVRTNKDINIAEGDFAKKLREALGQDEERGGEIAIRQERPDPSGVATTMVIGERLNRPSIFSDGALGNGIKWDVAEPKLSIEMAVSFSSPMTFDLTVFGKAVV